MAEFKAEVISDTHLNLWNYTPEQIANIFPAKAPNLVLAGDIGDPDHASLYTAIKIACSKYKRVIYIPGNHEFYNRVPGSKKTPASVLEWFRKLEEQFINFHFFYRRTEVYDGIRIIGVTAWSTAPTGTLWANMISKEGKKDIEFLEQTISRSTEPVLVITHYPSTMRVLQDSFKGKITEYNYAQNLEYMYRYPVNTWIFGHVHQNHDFTMSYSSSMGGAGKVRIICNPYGYPNEPSNVRQPLQFTITRSSRVSVKSPDGRSYQTL